MAGVSGLGARRSPGLRLQALQGNERFVELWASAAVSAHPEDHKIIDHPSVGTIVVDCDVLTDGDAELKIVILTAAAHTEDETRLRLAFLGGVTVPASA